MGHKCELENCDRITDSYLCDEHRKKLETGKYHIGICSECSAILKLSKSYFKNNLLTYGSKDQELKYYFIDKSKCIYCKQWKGKLHNE